MATAKSQPEIALYSYYASSCSGRVRLSLAFKSLEYTYITLWTGDVAQKHLQAEYTRLNPSQSVPTLIFKSDPTLTTAEADGIGSNQEIVIGQSWAALEYLEEVFPDRRRLVPKDPLERCRMRELAMIIISDTQPLTNTRVTKRLKSLSSMTEDEVKQDWVKHFFDRGMKAYDNAVEKSAGKFSVGDQVTLADLCLLPAVWNVLRVGMSLDPYPNVSRIYDALKDLPEVKKAHWQNQPDSPK